MISSYFSITSFLPVNIPIDDEKTYELFQRGETVAIFQYESEGMRKHMRDLKPTVFADLIAMNALYRPGPMEYIPQFMGPPLLQVNCMQTPQIIMQSGESVGVTGYIQPPAPYWPQFEHSNRRSIVRGTCQKKGRLQSLLWPTQ